MKIIIGNWKMNPQTVEEARVLASRVENGFLVMNRQGIEAVVCPPAVFIPSIFHTLQMVRLGAQNVSAEESGAFTGEISASQLAEFKISHVVVGHSERRALGEDDEFIAKKIKILLKHKIHPVLCVGFGARKGASNLAVKKITAQQVKAAISGLKLSEETLTIAYEPVWAIGSGRPATPDHTSKIANHIRSLAPVRVLYGGSMDGKNAERFAHKGLDGGLIGGASLKYEEFLKIIMAFSS